MRRSFEALKGCSATLAQLGSLDLRFDEIEEQSFLKSQKISLHRRMLLLSAAVVISIITLQVPEVIGFQPMMPTSSGLSANPPYLALNGLVVLLALLSAVISGLCLARQERIQWVGRARRSSLTESVYTVLWSGILVLLAIVADFAALPDGSLGVASGIFPAAFEVADQREILYLARLALTAAILSAWGASIPIRTWMKGALLACTALAHVAAWSAGLRPHKVAFYIIIITTYAMLTIHAGWNAERLSRQNWTLKQDAQRANVTSPLPEASNLGISLSAMSEALDKMVRQCMDCTLELTQSMDILGAPNPAPSPLLQVLPGRSFLDHLHPSDRRSALSLITRVSTTHIPEGETFRWQPIDNRSIPLSVYCLVIDGGPTGRCTVGLRKLGGSFHRIQQEREQSDYLSEVVPSLRDAESPNPAVQSPASSPVRHGMQAGNGADAGGSAAVRSDSIQSSESAERVSSGSNPGGYSHHMGAGHELASSESGRSASSQISFTLSSENSSGSSRGRIIFKAESGTQTSKKMVGYEDQHIQTDVVWSTEGFRCSRCSLPPTAPVSPATLGDRPLPQMAFDIAASRGATGGRRFVTMGRGTPGALPPGVRSRSLPPGVYRNAQNMMRPGSAGSDGRMQMAGAGMAGRCPSSPTSSNRSTPGGPTPTSDSMKPAPPSPYDLNGNWVLEHFRHAPLRWIRSLDIAGTKVADESGGTSHLIWDTGRWTCAEGVLFLENGQLIRVSKTGAKFFYDPLEEAIKKENLPTNVNVKTAKELVALAPPRS